jgi:L-threonylcarbamoyladenylate synthase
VNPAFLEKAVEALKNEKIIAYPTEGVYGLGCDPKSESALIALLTLKGRVPEKGFILIGSHLEQFSSYIAPLTKKEIKEISETEEVTTWLVPKGDSLSFLLCGSYPTVGIRVTTHPIAKALCEAFGRPLVSTSANVSGGSPARTAEEVKAQFQGSLLGYVVEGAVGSLGKPSTLRDLKTREILRP